MTEKVVHPSHYNQHPSGIECLTIVRHMVYNRGSAMAYIWRAGIKNKDEEITDLEKAVFHLQDEIALLKEEEAKAQMVSIDKAEKKAPTVSAVPLPPTGLSSVAAQPRVALMLNTKEGL